MKINRTRFVHFFLAIALLISTASDAQAQNRKKSGVASLGEMGCMTVQGAGGYTPINEDIPVELEIFRAFAFLGNRNFRDGSREIDSDKPLQVACRLAAVNAAPQFKTLNLSFGFSQTNERLDGSVIVRLAIYKDGNFYGEKTITSGDKLTWPIDIKNTRSLALEAQCVRHKQNNSSCPSIYFFEDTLRK
jgi:hypothetical protein